MTVKFTAQEFHAAINLEEMPKLPLHKIRKLFRLLYADRFADNTEAIKTITNWLPEAVAIAKGNWQHASHDYQNKWTSIDSWGYTIPAAKQRSINRPLISAVKKGKAAFERISKIQIMFQEINNKEKKNYA